MIYEYYVNLNERGSFYADVRDEHGTTVAEVRAGNELAEDEMSLVDAGYMKHFEDLDGLADYLRTMGIMQPSDGLVKGN